MDPIYMTIPDKQAALTGIAAARARLDAIELKVLAVVASKPSTRPAPATH